MPCESSAPLKGVASFVRCGDMDTNESSREHKLQVRACYDCGGHFYPVDPDLEILPVCPRCRVLFRRLAEMRKTGNQWPTPIILP